MDWATVALFGVGTFLSIMAWLINRNVGHVDQRQERMERKHDAFVEKMDGKLDGVHGRITEVEKAHAGLRGEFNAATRPDSKSGVPKFKGG